MQHSDSFDEEKREANDYLALQTPSNAARPTATLVPHTVITSSTLDLHSVDERKEGPLFQGPPTSVKVDPLGPTSPSAVHHISVLPTQKSSTIDAAATPAPPCPGQRAEWTWRFPTLLYFGWLTPLMLLGGKRPLQFADLWQTFNSDQADAIWKEFDPAWQAQVVKAKAQGRKPKLLNTFTRVYGLEMLWCCLAYGWVNADACWARSFCRSWWSTARRSSTSPHGRGTNGERRGTHRHSPDNTLLASPCVWGVEGMGEEEEEMRVTHRHSALTAQRCPLLTLSFWCHCHFLRVCVLQVLRLIHTTTHMAHTAHM